MGRLTIGAFLTPLLFWRHNYISTQLPTLQHSPDQDDGLKSDYCRQVYAHIVIKAKMQRYQGRWIDFSIHMVCNTKLPSHRQKTCQEATQRKLLDLNNGEELLDRFRCQMLLFIGKESCISNNHCQGDPERTNRCYQDHTNGNILISKRVGHFEIQLAILKPRKSTSLCMKWRNLPRQLTTESPTSLNQTTCSEI
jgi:hypothetical protein